MGLMNKLRENKGGIAGNIAGVFLLGEVGLLGTLAYKNNIANNLEENAPFIGSVILKYPQVNAIRNKDIDKNGKYETILDYTIEKGKTASALIQYDKEKGIIVKPYKLETRYDSLTGKELKTIKVLE